MPTYANLIDKKMVIADDGEYVGQFELHKPERGLRPHNIKKLTGIPLIIFNVDDFVRAFGGIFDAYTIRTAKSPTLGHSTYHVTVHTEIGSADIPTLKEFVATLYAGWSKLFYTRYPSVMSYLERNAPIIHQKEGVQSWPSIIRRFRATYQFTGHSIMEQIEANQAAFYSKQFIYEGHRIPNQVACDRASFDAYCDMYSIGRPKEDHIKPLRYRYLNAILESVLESYFGEPCDFALVHPKCYGMYRCQRFLEQMCIHKLPTIFMSRKTAHATNYQRGQSALSA